jgi:hypothetical protein|nr:MAG TPA: peptidase [Caudoviricetes sp.]
MGDIGGRVGVIYNINYIQTMKNIDIYETIYEVDIAVCNKKCTNKDIINNFLTSDDKEITEEFLSVKPTTNAYTFRAINKHNRHATFVVRILKTFGNTKLEKDTDLINTIAHEAMHIVLDTFDKIGEIVSVHVQEPYAYYIGWICECIYKSYKK